MNPAAREAVETLRRRELEARRAREDHALEVRRAVERVVEGRLRPPVRAWLVGSLAWGGFGSGSDVDLVFSGIDSAAMMDLEVRVGRAAQAPVDLLILEELPAGFQQRVIDSGIRIV